jgi:acetyl esterase/lipase
MTLYELFRADVAVHRDLPYVEGGDERHRLDIYAPPGARGLPVVIFFYGGGWRSGDKRLFEHLGRAFATRGIVAVTVNYRLTPAVTSPSHAEDCAAAVAWVHAGIGEYGGDPASLFLMGHSAGAHLAALLTVDGHYLAEAGAPAESLRGTILISGVADLRAHSQTTVFTSREQIEEAFGNSQEELEASSPILYVRPGLPPFLVVVAQEDPPGLRDQGKAFADALRDAGVDVLFISVKGRDHFSIVRRFGPSDDTTAEAVAEFIRHHAGGKAA